MDSTQLSRLLANVIRLGAIAEVDHDAARCRVTSGDIESDWLPWLALRAGDTRIWSPPTVGEQCMVFSPSGNLGAGVVIVGIFSDDHAAPSHDPDAHSIHFPDGAVIQYNHASHHLSVTGITSAEVVASGDIVLRSGTQITLDAPRVVATHELIAQGLLTYQAGLSGRAATTIHGAITHDGGELTSNGVILHSHVHSGVAYGPSNTGEPVR